MLKPFWNKKGHLGFANSKKVKEALKAATKVEANPTLAGTEADLTGLLVDDTKYAVPQPINVVANPTLAGTEADLTGLEVGETKYKVPAPINVVANPTLAGTEADLTSLEVGDTKYKIPSGGGGSGKYFHQITMTGRFSTYGSSITGVFTFNIINDTETAITDSTIYTALVSAGAGPYKQLPINGAIQKAANNGLRVPYAIYPLAGSSIYVKFYDYAWDFDNKTVTTSNSEDSFVMTNVKDFVFAL